jgi:beta-galactosidase
MRQSAAGQEKFHGAVISHSGRTDTRIFKEISGLGAELKKLGSSIIGAETRCEVGMIMDWSNWWALENNSGPTIDMDYISELHRYYCALYSNNIQVDFLKTTSDLSGYKVILAPLLYMLPADTAKKLIQFTENGGTLIATYMTGWADEDDRCVYGAYPGLLRDVLGLWAEETDALFPDERNGICITEEFRRKEGFDQVYSSDFLCERIHPEGARVLGFYKDDFYSGEPCFTVDEFGKGRAYYIATRPEPAFLDALIKLLMKDCRISAPFPVEGAVEITVREKNNNKTYFVICQDPEGGLIDLGAETLTDRLTGETLSGSVKLRFRDVLVLGND